jgi:8-oxo-dGTP diphosphatase
MRKLNLIIIFNTNLNKGLFCIRTKELYKVLYNLVGGKVENGETNDEAAYRELFEETGISKDDIELDHFADVWCCDALPKEYLIIENDKFIVKEYGT